MFSGYRKTKKNIKKIEKTVDNVKVPLYNINKLKRVSEQIKKRTGGTARNTQFIITRRDNKRKELLLSYKIVTKKANEIQNNKKSSNREQQHNSKS